MDLQSYIFISLSLQTSRSLLFVTSIFILLSEDRSVLWLLRTKIREPFGLSQIFCLLVKRTGLAYQRIILHIGNWWTIGKKLPQDAIKVTMNHNSRSVEHKTLLTALNASIYWKEPNSRTYFLCLLIIG